MDSSIEDVRIHASYSVCPIFALRALSAVDPPDPIPNSEVKHRSADDSWGVAPCESRSVRGVIF